MADEAFSHFVVYLYSRYSTLALTIASSIIVNTTVAVGAAVYSIFIFIITAIFGALSLLGLNSATVH